MSKSSVVDWRCCGKLLSCQRAYWTSVSFLAFETKMGCWLPTTSACTTGEASWPAGLSLNCMTCHQCHAWFHMGIALRRLFSRFPLGYCKWLCLQTTCQCMQHRPCDLVKCVCKAWWTFIGNQGKEMLQQESTTALCLHIVVVSWRCLSLHLHWQAPQRLMLISV